MAAIRWLDVRLRGAQPNLPQRYASKKKPGICRAFCVQGLRAMRVARKGAGRPSTVRLGSSGFRKSGSDWKPIRFGQG